MTAQSKTTIKSYFETGDKPTQAQFADLIDSYVDSVGLLGNLQAVASAGGVGLAQVLSANSAAVVSAGAAGLRILAAITTAQAQSQLSLGSLATANQISLVTQVSGNLPVTNLASGVNASAGTVWKGDGTWGAVISVATTAQVQAGTNNTVAITPSGLKGAIGFSNSYISSAQSLALSTTTTLAHGLGTTPFHSYVHIVCVSADSGYTAGDVVTQFVAVDDGSSGRGWNFNVSQDATNLYVSTANTGISVINRTTPSSPVQITLTNWRFVAKAWS